MSVAENEDIDSVKEYLKNKIACLEKDSDGKNKDGEKAIKEAQKALDELGK